MKHFPKPFISQIHETIDTITVYNGYLEKIAYFQSFSPTKKKGKFYMVQTTYHDLFCLHLTIL